VNRKSSKDREISSSSDSRNTALSRTAHRRGRFATTGGLLIACGLFLARSASMASPLPIRSAAPLTPAPAASQVLLPVSLETSLDSKKKNVGDEVEGKIATLVHLSDGTVIPQGAKVVGHVTASKAKSKGDSESSLAIVFEKVSLSAGKTLNIKGYIRAVGPNPNTQFGSGGVDYGGLNQATQHSQTGMTPESIPLLSDTSEGVVGIKNLTLDNDGVLRSDGKTVKVEHEAQILLRAEVLSTP
jgi:hypothetical protein